MQFAQSPQQKDFPSSIFYLSLLFFKNQKSKIEGKKLKLGFKLISLKIQSQEKPDQPGMVISQNFFLEFPAVWAATPPPFRVVLPPRNLKNFPTRLLGQCHSSALTPTMPQQQIHLKFVTTITNTLKKTALHRIYALSSAKFLGLKLWL